MSDGLRGPISRVRRALFVPAWASVLLLAACTSTAPLNGTSTTPPLDRSSPSDAAQQSDPVAVADRTVAAGRIASSVVHAGQWKLVRGPFARHCSDIGTQLQFEWDARGPKSTNVRHDADAALDAYKKSGFKVVFLTHTASDMRLLASSDRDGTVEFDARANGINVAAISTCIVGDPATYKSMSPEPPN